MNQKTTKRIIYFLLVTAFFFNTCCYGYGPFLSRQHNLSPPTIFQQAFSDEKSPKFKKSLLSDIKFLTAMFSIARHFLVDNKNKKTLSRLIKDKFRNNKDFLNGINLEDVYRKDNIIYIPYKRNGKEYEVKICQRDKLDTIDKTNSEWGVSKGFGIQVELANSLEKYIKRLITPSVLEYDRFSEDERDRINEERCYWDVFNNHILPKLKAERKKLKAEGEPAVLTFGITGSAASGKTTVAQGFKNALAEKFNNVQMILFDDRLLQASDRKIDTKTGKTTEDVFKKFEVKKFIASIKAFIKGQNLLKPVYSQTAKGRLKIILDEEGRLTILFGPKRKIIIVDTPEGVMLAVQDENGDILEKAQKVSSFEIPFAIEEIKKNGAKGELVLKILNTRYSISAIDASGKRVVQIIDKKGADLKNMVDSNTGRIIADSGTILTAKGHIDLKGKFVKKPWDVKECIPHEDGVFIVEGILSLHDDSDQSGGESLPELYTTSMFVDVDFEIRMERGLLREKSRAEELKGESMPQEEAAKYIDKFTQRKERLEDPFIYATQHAAEFVTTTKTRAEGIFSIYRNGQLLSEKFKTVIEEMGLDAQALNDELDRIEKDFIFSSLIKATHRRNLQFERKIEKTNYDVYFLKKGFVVKVPKGSRKKNDISDSISWDIIRKIAGELMVPGMVVDLSLLNIKVENANYGNIFIQNKIDVLKSLLVSVSKEKARFLLDRFFDLQKNMWELGIIDKMPSFDR